MAAEENALQLLNEMVICGIRAFLSDPGQKNLSHLVHSPAVYKVAEREFRVTSAIDDTTLAVFQWLYVRAFVVLAQLSKYGAPISCPTPIESAEWIEVL